MLSTINNRLRHKKIGAILRTRWERFPSPSVDFKPRKIRFGTTETAMAPSDVLIENLGGNLSIAWRPEAVEKREMRQRISSRGLAYLYYAARAGKSVTSIICDVSDGSVPSIADVGFSSSVPGRGLLPDFHFFEGQGYQKQREYFRERSVPWANRNNAIVWRGSMTGTGLRFGTIDQKENGLVNQRLRMALVCKNTDIDFRFVDAFEASDIARKMDLLAERIPAEAWLDRKFAIDIDGNSNAWCNPFHRMLFGCCILKVQSQGGFRQWYYDRLIPFKHFVPVKADLSDLEEQLDWVRSHPIEAEAIAAAGCELAHSMTFESETKYAAEEMARICGNKRDTIPASELLVPVGRNSSAPI